MRGRCIFEGIPSGECFRLGCLSHARNETGEIQNYNTGSG